MNRRETIQLTAVSIALLSGCASNSAVAPTASPVTSVAMAPLASVTMLPVENADYYVLDARDIETQAVISNDDANKKLTNVIVDRAAIDAFHAQMTALQLSVHKKFDQALQARLRQAGVSMMPYSAADQAIAVRANGDVARLGPGTDAVVDVRIETLGYRPIASEVALTPEVRIALQFVRVADSANLGSATYSFDWREFAENARHFRCDPNDLFSSVDKLMANLPRAAAVLDRGTMQMVDRVADDIIQIYSGNALT